MENSQLNSCRHSQVLAYPGHVAQYPQTVVPVYSYVPYANRVSAPPLSVGLQDRSVYPVEPFYQQPALIPQAVSASSCHLAQIMEKHSETTSGSLVEYSYLPAANGECQPAFSRPARHPGWQGFPCHNHAVHPGLAGTGLGGQRHPLPTALASGQGGYRPAAAAHPQVVGNMPHEHFQCPTLVQHAQTVSTMAGREGIIAPVVTPPPAIILNAPQVNCSAPPLPLPEIDLAALIPEPCPKGDVDADMKLLYLQHLPASELPALKQPDNFLARVQGNYALHHNHGIPRFSERRQLIATLSRHFQDTDEFEDIRKNRSHCTATLKKLLQKHQVLVGEAITPAHCILFCIAPFLPCTANRNISICARYLRPYAIPFASLESSVSTAQAVSAAPADEPLPGDNGTIQLSIILLVMAMLGKTFPIKLRQLSGADRSISSKDITVHGKFVAHMVLTALLYCQHEASVQNIARFLSITGYFLKHLIAIHQFPGLCDEVALDLTRAMLTLLSHDIAKTELLALMHGSVRKAEPQTSGHGRDTHQQTFRSKSGSLPADKLEDFLISRGRVLARSLQSLMITTLTSCLKANAIPHYFATLTTLSVLPLFTPQLIQRNNDNCQALISHLTGVIDWMEQGLQKDCRCFTDFALLRTIIDTISGLWLPGLTFQVASMAGWQPCTHLHMSHKQWLFKQLRAPGGGRLKPLPELLALAKSLNRLEQGALSKMIEEDKVSREFEAETNALAKRMDELNQKKNQKIVSKPPRALPYQRDSRLRQRQDSYQQPTEQPPPLFASDVASFCRQLDFSADLGDLRAAVPPGVEEKLVHPSHQLWLFTEMAFQGFHQHRELIIRSAKAMSAAWCTYKKLTGALAEPRAEFVNQWQSVNWLNERFIPSELSPKRLASVLIQTEPEKLGKACRVTSNVLALFERALKPGTEVLEALSAGGKLTGELALHELRVHVDICHEAVKLLLGHVKTLLERKVISHEIPRLRTQLFEQLHLDGANSLERPYHGPEDARACQILKDLEQDSSAYRQYHLQPFDQVEAQALLSGYQKIHLGLHARPSVPQVPRTNPADQQRSAVNADASEHQ